MDSHELLYETHVFTTVQSEIHFNGRHRLSSLQLVYLGADFNESREGPKDWQVICTDKGCPGKDQEKVGSEFGKK